MTILSPETVNHDTEPIDEESKRKFIRTVTEAFSVFYKSHDATGNSDIDDHMKRLKEFENDEVATINYIYGALLAANLDVSAFIESTGLLETVEEQ